MGLCVGGRFHQGFPIEREEEEEEEDDDDAESASDREKEEEEEEEEEEDDRGCISYEVGLGKGAESGNSACSSSSSCDNAE